MRLLDRRGFVQLGCAAGIAAISARGGSQPGVRAITRGPKYHWYAYYDKLAFNLTNRYVLGAEVDFEHRSPRADDRIRVGMIDLEESDRWIDLGKSDAWNWQQGCMLQWIPGSANEVIWNDREADGFISRILNVETGRTRTIPAPVYAVSPDGRTAVTVDFERIQRTRPGYGYAGIRDRNETVLAPDNAGIYRVDLDSGRKQLIIPIREIAKIPFPGDDLTSAEHWFNHLLFNTDGTRFSFLHRWRPVANTRYRNVGGFVTRMLTATPDGKDIRIVDPHGFTSHYIWRDSSHILAWAYHPSNGSAFYLYEDGTDRVEVIGKDAMTVNGHCSYLPGNEWILNDTYPDKARVQHVYLYHVASGRRVEIGAFPLPKQYAGEWRCDTHPRFSRNGRFVAVDSAHGGDGRQIYLIDIKEIMTSEPGQTIATDSSCHRLA